MPTTHIFRPLLVPNIFSMAEANPGRKIHRPLSSNISPNSPSCHFLLEMNAGSIAAVNAFRSESVN